MAERMDSVNAFRFQIALLALIGLVLAVVVLASRWLMWTEPSGRLQASSTYTQQGGVSNPASVRVVLSTQVFSSTNYLPLLLRINLRLTTTMTPTPTPTSTATAAPSDTPAAKGTPTSAATRVPTATQTPVLPGSSVYWSIDMGGRGTDPTIRDLAAAAGFRLHRTSVSWAAIEPNAPVGGVHTYNWPDGTFNVFRNDRRLMPYVIVMNNPIWAVPSGQRTCGPIDLARLGDFDDFVYELVSRYADVTRYWVFYNEADQWTEHTDDAGGCWGGHGAEYAEMLGVAWDAAHRADPNAQVIFGAAAYEPVWDQGNTWDRFFYRDAFRYMRDNPLPAGREYVDIIAANQYNFRRDDWDGGTGTLPKSQDVWAKFFQAVSDASFNVNTPGAYSIARWQAEYGLDKPMATGEVGLQVGGTGGADNSTTNDIQARHVVHVNVRGMAAGLKIINWYTLVDKPNDPFKYGLLRSDLTPRPAYYAYQEMTQQLDGYVFDQQLVVSGKPYIQAYRFDKGGVKKLVLFRDTGQKIKSQNHSATETMTIGATELGTWTGQVRVTDKLGNETIHSGDSLVSLTFTTDPIYVEVVQ